MKACLLLPPLVHISHQWHMAPGMIWDGLPSSIHGPMLVGWHMGMESHQLGGVKRMCLHSLVLQGGCRHPSWQVPLLTLVRVA